MTTTVNSTAYYDSTSIIVGESSRPGMGAERMVVSLIGTRTRQPRLTKDEFNELAWFINGHGRTWKSKLRDLWSSGSDTLRETRNTLGPSGLNCVKICRYSIR